MRQARTVTSESLREPVLAGVRSIAGARLVVEILALGASVAVARLVPPSEFGHAVVPIVIIGFSATLLGGVVGSPLVQRDELTQEHRRVAALLGLLVGLFLSAVTWLAAAPVAGPLFGERTAELVAFAAPSFLLAALAVVPHALLQRELRFARLGQIEVAAVLCGLLTTVTLASAGAGAGALVVGGLVGVAASSVGALVGGPWAAPWWHRSEAAQIIRFGIPVGIGSLGYQAFRNVDYVMVGARLGAAQLAVYWRGFQLGVEYQRKLSVVMQRIAFPVFSRTGDAAHLRALRTRIVRAHATVIFPLLALLAVTAPEVVPFVYGDAWEAAVVPTQILAVAGMLAAAQTGIGPLMMALGETVRLMVFSWISVLVYGGAIFLVAPLGLTAVCVTVVGVGLAVFLVGSYVLGTRIAGIPMSALLGELGPALAGSTALVPVAAATGELLRLAGGSGVAIAGPMAVAGIAAYAAVVRLISPSAWSDISLVLGRTLKGRGADVRAPAARPASGSASA